MTIKGVLVHVEASAAAQARVRCAADLADRFDALLIGCGAEMPPRLSAEPFTVADGEVIATLNRRVDEHLAKAKVQFEDLAPGIERRWIASRMMPDEALTLAARSADLIIVDQSGPMGQDAFHIEDPGLLVVISGRPVLVLPTGCDHVAGRRILVCWKDSREARRAVKDALPFLIRADEVLVCEVAAKESLGAACDHAAEVAEWLVCHGAKATGEGLIRDERRAVTILQDRADSFGADLLVSGAYGRSRLGEWAFGGVTKSLLGQTERPILLSH